MRPNADELFDELAHLDLTLDAIAACAGGANLALQQALQRHVRSLRIFLDMDAAAVLHDVAEAAQRLLEANEPRVLETAQRDLARMRALMDAMLRRQAGQQATAA